MSLKLYNTASRKLETFKPSGDVVKVYTCGPTVYGYQHIGNYAAYVYWDLLVRVLRANDYAVRRVLNLTDVGHLVSDGDEGEDKLEKGARREGVDVWEVAQKFIDDFLANYRRLKLSEPEVIARATDYIAEDMEAVDLMRERGYTYEIEDGVYYDTSKFPGYADFARLDVSGLKAGARVEFSDKKRSATDFAVWKFIKPGEKHAMRWDYLGRPGYPGWHLECSTIIHKELGEPIDIHTGGVDHIPIHHTNEIAECYAAYGHALARIWMHCNFITVEGEKISKSLGNVYLLSDLEEKGFSPMDYKMWLLSGHYQGTRNFTFDSLEGAQNRRKAWRERIASCYQAGQGGAVTGSATGVDFRAQLLDAVNNNLNSAEAFKVIDENELRIADWEYVDEMFGLGLMEETPDVPAEVYELMRERDAVRAEKNYARSDEIRDELGRRGIGIRDTADGGKWYYL